MDWTTVVVSLGGSLIVACMSILGIFLNNHFQTKREQEQERKQKQKETFLQRPRLTIRSATDPYPFNQEEKCDIGLFFPYQGYMSVEEFDHIANTKNDWTCIDYFFENVGSIEIAEIYFSTKNQLKLYDIYSATPQWDFQKSGSSFAIKACRIVKPQETFSLKACYLNDNSDELQRLKNYNYLSWERTSDKTLNVWLVDTDGNWWKQILFIPEGQIRTSSPADDFEYSSSAKQRFLNSKRKKR